MRKLICLLFTIGHLHAQQPVRLSFNNEFSANDTVMIFEYYAGRHVLVQSINPFVNAEYTLTMPSHAGLFLIQLKGSASMAQFIYNPADELSIGVRKTELNRGVIFFSEDRENACYTYVLKALAVYDNRMDSIQTLMFSLDKTDVHYQRRYKALDSLYYATAFEKNYSLSYVRFMYEHSYCDQVIIPLLLVPLVPPLEKKTYNSWIHYTIQNFFEHANVNQQLLYTNIFETQLMRYISTFGTAPNWNAGLCIDRIVQKFGSDSVVMSYAADYLIQISIKAGAYKFAQYVDEKSTPCCKVEGMDWEALYSRNAFKVFKGGFVEKTYLNGLKGNKRELLGQLKKGTNWLLFYNEPCDSLDGVITSYIQMASKNAGDNRLAIFVGNDTKTWQRLIGKYRLDTWNNLSELLPASQSLLVKNLLVNRTPLLFRLDENGYIQKRYLVPADF